MNITKLFRNKHGLTQKQLCDLLPCSRRTLENWEAADDSAQHRNPPEYLKRALSDVARELQEKDK